MIAKLAKLSSFLESHFKRRRIERAHFYTDSEYRFAQSNEDWRLNRNVMMAGTVGAVLFAAVLVGAIILEGSPC